MLILTGMWLWGCDDSADVIEPIAAEEETEENEESSNASETVVNDSETEENVQKPEMALHVEYADSESTAEGLHWSVEETDSGEFWVNVSAVELKDVLGIAFHLKYNPEVIGFVEAQSTDILRNNKAEVSTLFRPGSNVIYFGTVRIHEPLGGGQGLVYTGLDVPKGIIAKFKFSPLAAGSGDIEITKEGLDLRNADLEPINISTSGSTLTIVEKEVQL
jgi:hypothetical protein